VTDYVRVVEPEPPYVDQHDVVVRAGRERVWAALTSYVDGVLASRRSPLFVWIWDPEPASGFAVDSRVEGERIELVGRHRFSRYRLVFSLDGTAPTTLAATTYAAFPGPHGAAYRVLVIRTRLHVVATRRMLEVVRRRAVAG
jgi:hypothetical protein